jgi:hypothetical protein
MARRNFSVNAQHSEGLGGSSSGACLQASAAPLLRLDYSVCLLEHSDSAATELSPKLQLHNGSGMTVAYKGVLHNLFWRRHQIVMYTVGPSHAHKQNERDRRALAHGRVSSA